MDSEFQGETSYSACKLDIASSTEQGTIHTPIFLITLIKKNMIGKINRMSTGNGHIIRFIGLTIFADSMTLIKVDSMLELILIHILCRKAKIYKQYVNNNINAL